MRLGENFLFVAEDKFLEVVGNLLVKEERAIMAVKELLVADGRWPAAEENSLVVLDTKEAEGKIIETKEGCRWPSERC